MKKNKVLFVCQNISEFKDRILPCFMFIKNKGYDIDLVCEDSTDIAFIDNKYVFECTENIKLINNIKIVRKLKDIIKNSNYDVIQTLDNSSSLRVYSALKRIKRNTVQTLYYIENVKNNRLLKKAIKASDIVYTNNEVDYNYLITKKYNSNVKLIHDLAIDFRKFNNIDFNEAKKVTREKYNLDDDKKYVSLIGVDKDYKYVTKVIKELVIQNSNICFLIKDTSIKLLENLKNNNCLQHVKIIEDAKWLEVLFLSDSVVFVNIKAYDLNIFVYALMLGVPVIVPKEEFLNQYIEEQVNGFLCFKKNVQQTILAIGRSINIPKIKLENLTKLNYNYISKFSSDKYISLISNMYEEIKVESKKDIYIIENLRKKENAEVLISDIQRNDPKDATIITIDTSKNDEKLRKIGVEVKNFNFETYNDKLKFRKFINKILLDKKFNSISVYGNMNKIIRKSKILLEGEELITRYDKI